MLLCDGGRIAYLHFNICQQFSVFSIKVEATSTYILNINKMKWSLS